MLAMHFFATVCMCVCVCTRVRACVYVCVQVSDGIVRSAFDYCSVIALVISWRGLSTFQLLLW